MTGQPAFTPPPTMLTWRRTVTRTDASDTTGEIYEATLTGDFTGPINLRIGRHPGWPAVWHLQAECGGTIHRSIAAEQDGPFPLMLRMETFAERWALAGTMPNVL